MRTTLPFQGFYESVHDEGLCWGLDNMFTAENGDAIEDLQVRANDVVDWGRVYVLYAIAYAGAFATEYEIPSLKFAELDSPREYNFTTDRIFCEISEADVRRLFAEVDKAALSTAAKARHTSYSGFHSFYDPDWTTWGDVASWDHNQVCTLLVAVAEDLDEEALMESDRNNGRLDEWFTDNNEPMVQLLNELDQHRQEDH